MRSADVVIVGGGPAGSSCARRLRERGADVVVIDRRTFPRDKICAGWVTPEVFAALALDPAEYAPARRTNGDGCGEALTLQPITGFRTGMIGGREVHTDYGRPVSYGIRRCEFDHFLLERCGAELRLGQPLDELRRDGGRWIVNGEVSAPLLVGAGGHFCPVARQLGGRETATSPVVAAQEVEFRIPSGKEAGVTVRPEVPELFFCPDLAGYGWCFRKGDYLNIGLGRTDKARISEHVAEFGRFLRDRGKLDFDLPDRFHGHAYCLYEGRPARVVGEGWVLIGDAAGLAYPQSGEGIRPAVESGLIAADVLHESAAGSFDLNEYERRLRERLGEPRRGGPGQWLPASWLALLAGRLMSSRWFARRVVLDRWFLHRDQPALKLPQPTASR
jgi:geranylgeranyl reductase family protein